MKRDYVFIALILAVSGYAYYINWKNQQLKLMLITEEIEKEQQEQLEELKKLEKELRDALKDYNALRESVINES